MAEYIFQDQLGEGGFGVVYHATRVEDGWKCVIKQLKKGVQEEESRRFRREVTLLQQLDHPNIISIVGANFIDESPWYVMPLASTTLKKLITTDGDLNLMWAFYDVLKGLEYMHGQGVAHRDLKPENILIFEDEAGDSTAVISDLGLGCHINHETSILTKTNTLMGTFKYAPPEQLIDAKRADERSDIYSLGKILCEIVSGEASPVPQAFDYSRAPEPYKFIIQKCTDNTPQKRYQSIAELRRDLEKLTQKKFEIKPALELDLLIKNALQSLPENPALTSEVADFFLTNENDLFIVTQKFPRIPVKLLKIIINTKKPSFMILLNQYLTMIDFGVTYDYCDIVADFFYNIFLSTTDSDIIQPLIYKILLLGPAKNRWHVGEMGAKMISLIESYGILSHINTFFEQNERHAEWWKGYLLKENIHPLIRTTLMNLGDSRPPMNIR